LIWGGDHDLDDFEDMEYSFVTNLHCPKCESYVEVYYPKRDYVCSDESSSGHDE
tara:strand:+ start:149 stop:310 length:162 start_codon:yes stop_codon:yes gene_type:complete